MEIPRLTRSPQLYPGCCCSLSTVLIEHLASYLPSGSELALSIGSGSGLLEYMLVIQRPMLKLYAVEVAEKVNDYLPKTKLDIVHGTWDISPLAKDASAWMFVYPRDVRLVKRYLASCADSMVNMIIWIGPMADFEEYDPLPVGQAWVKEVPTQGGLSDFEAMIIWKKRDDAIGYD